NTVTTDNSGVTLSLNAAASGGGGVLDGTATQSASGGVATFSGLSVVSSSNPSYSAAGAGYTLEAADSNASVTAAKSAAFNATFIVATCSMTPTGFVATFSQPFNPGEVNLYSAASSGSLPANVVLEGNKENAVHGSLVIDSTDTKITFVATTLVNSSGLPIA